jgi:hypothetical protein
MKRMIQFLKELIARMGYKLHHRFPREKPQQKIKAWPMSRSGIYAHIG